LLRYSDLIQVLFCRANEPLPRWLAVVALPAYMVMQYNTFMDGPLECVLRPSPPLLAAASSRYFEVVALVSCSPIPARACRSQFMYYDVCKHVAVMRRYGLRTGKQELVGKSGNIKLVVMRSYALRTGKQEIVGKSGNVKIKPEASFQRYVRNMRPPLLCALNHVQTLR
jgi:hypothetical protein